MGLLAEIFTWWNGQTMGTRLFTSRHGQRVGEDEFGNVYYRAKDIPPHGERRWVVYNGIADPSFVPAAWHGWLHHRSDTHPGNGEVAVREWQLPHKPNMTGTPGAYRPDGSLLTPERRPAATGDYDIWSPE
ncbi:MAG: NADH:ubiquinone oxidoreductase subunit NDUFA12 [Pseudomonadota bacterium]